MNSSVRMPDSLGLKLAQVAQRKVKEIYGEDVPLNKFHAADPTSDQSVYDIKVGYIANDRSPQVVFLTLS